MKLAGVLGAVTRHRQRLAELKPRLFCLQFGGASGSLAALGEQAWPVAEALARELELNLPDQPWHTQRDRLVEFASLLGLIAGSLGKLGRDLSLLMQTEAGEVFEPSAPGKGGSSTMPHKRNPVSAAVLIGAASRAPGLVSTMFAAMPQEHERSLGLWHAEWETLPELCCLVSGALQQALLVVPGLEVDAARMRRNLDLTQGLVLAEAVSIALAQRIGRDAAHHLVEQCCRQAVKEGAHLRAVLGGNAEVSAQLSAAELDRLLDPAHYLGQARRWVDRALAEHKHFSR
jgi:3-carboxy-cis,cis-muconate cycloisomerase